MQNLGKCFIVIFVHDKVSSYFILFAGGENQMISGARTVTQRPRKVLPSNEQPDRSTPSNILKCY